MTWQDRAACRLELKPDHYTAEQWSALWFPNDYSGGREAKAICAACPVRTPCRNAAIAYGYDRTNYPAGIWAGLRSDELARQRKSASRARAKARAKERAS